MPEPSAHRDRLRPIMMLGSMSAAKLWQLEDALTGEPAAPPRADHWRYRRTGAPQLLALLGVVAGLALFVLPGLLAARSYRRWRRGHQLQPTLPWSLGVLALGAIPVVAVALATPWLGLAVVMALAGIPAALVIVLRG